MRMIRRALHMGAIWLLLSVCFWAVGTACLNSVIPASGALHYSMRFSAQNAPSFDGMKLYYDKKSSKGEKEVIPGLVTAWAEERNRQLSATEWKADVAVDIYYVDGNVMDIMELFLIAGGFPDRTDKTGISIDEKTAVKLFGASTPVGLEITLGGHRYTVRGVFECPKGISAFGSDTGRGLAVLSPPTDTSPSVSDTKSGEKIGVQGTEFIFPAGISPEEAKSYAMQLAGQMGLGGAVYTKDYSAGDKILRQFAHFPGWTMMAVAIIMLLYTAYSQTRMMLRLAWRRFRSRHISENKALKTLLNGILFGAIIILPAIAIYFFVRPDFSLPPSYIPNKWSDVVFWPELIRKMMVDQADRNALPVARPDAVLNTLTGWGIAFVAASLVSIHFFNVCLNKVLGCPVSTRLRHNPDEWLHPAAQWDASCYSLLLLSAAAPILGLKLSDIMGLKPVISGTVLTMQVIPIIMVSVELILRFWPSTLWPLRFSPVSKLLYIIHRIRGINLLRKNKNLEG